MATDLIARGMAARINRKFTPYIEDFGGGAGAPDWRNRTAIRDAFARGVSNLAFAGGSYDCDTVNTSEEVYSHWAGGSQPSVIYPANLRRFDGGGSELILKSSRGIISAPEATWGWPAHTSYIAADVASGATTLTLEAGEGASWQAGDEFIWRFGSLPYDMPETLNWGFARVLSVSGDQLTIDRPIPLPFALNDVSGMAFTDYFGVTGRYQKAITKIPATSGLEACNLVVTGAQGFATAHAIKLITARDVTVRQVGGRNVGNAIVLQYVENASIDGCWAEDANSSLGVPFGRGISLAECRSVSIRNFRAKGCRTAVFAEAGSQASIEGILIENTGDASTGMSFGSNARILQALGRSHLVVDNCTIVGFGGYILGETNVASDESYNGTIRFNGRLTMVHDSEPQGMRLEQFNCLLDYRIGGGHEEWDFASPKTWRRRMYLKNATVQDFKGPPGVVKALRIYSSTGLTFGSGNKLSGFYVGRDSGLGPDLSGKLLAGATVSLDILGGGNGGALWAGRNEQLKIRVNTTGATGLDTGDEYIDIECDIVTNRLAPAWIWSSQSDERNSGPGSGLREAVFTNYDPPNVPANGSAQVDLPIPAMAAGDLIEAISFSYPLNGISIRSAEAVMGAARIILANNTASAIDKTANTIRILWRKSLYSG